MPDQKKGRKRSKPLILRKGGGWFIRGMFKHFEKGGRKGKSLI